jgi:hypothetical protein
MIGSLLCGLAASMSVMLKEDPITLEKLSARGRYRSTR